MLAIKKLQPPDFFDSWKKNREKWSLKLREYMLEKEQAKVCCYCEKGISANKDKSLIEHIRPQSKFPALINTYNNLVVSCQTPRQCGNAKGNQFNENFILPTEEDPAKYLAYSPNGEIRSIDNNKKGSETIKILNLNAHALVKARKVLFIRLNQMKESVPDFENYFNEYPTFIKYFKENY